MVVTVVPFVGIVMLEFDPYSEDVPTSGTILLALKPPFAEIIEFSWAKTRLRSSSAAEGKAVANAGGAIGIPVVSSYLTLEIYDSSVDTSGRLVSAWAKSAITVGFARKDDKSSLSSSRSLRQCYCEITKVNVCHVRLRLSCRNTNRSYPEKPD